MTKIIYDVNFHPVYLTNKPGGIWMEIDGFLLDVFEKISQWIQMMFGIICFRIAAELYIGALVFNIVDNAIFILKHYSIFTLTLCLIDIITSLIFVTACILVNKVIQQIWEKERGFLNYGRLKLMPIRLLLLVITLIQIRGSIFDLMDWIFLTAGMYFTSCTPLSPRKSKAREWLDSWKTKLVPAPMPAK